MTLFDIPVFTFDVDWANTLTGHWTLDLREFQYGYGPKQIDPVNPFVLTGWELQVALRGDDIYDADALMDSLQGRTKPFWLPGPPAVFKIVDGIDATRFIIAEQGAEQSFGLDPGDYVWFSRLGSSPQNGKVLLITDNGDGTETVTLASGLSIAADESWTVQKLFLVRLTEDAEKINVIAERYQTRSIKVVELPHDYEAVEDGLDEPYAPIFLYRFIAPFPTGDVVWRYTSDPEDVTVSGHTWLSAPIEHKSLSRSSKSGGTITIVGDYQAIEPLTLSVPLRLSVQLQINVYETNLALDAPTTLFEGVVDPCDRDGRKVNAPCVEWGEAMNQRIPTFYIQPTCNYRVYEAATCKVDKTAFQVTVRVNAKLGRTVTIAGAGLVGVPTDWFARGWLDVGTGLNRRLLFVIASTAEDRGTVILSVSSPLDLEVPIVTALVLPGCDGNRTTCVDKFGNLPNFGGAIVPVDNLSLSAITVTQSGGKK